MSIAITIVGLILTTFLQYAAVQAKRERLQTTKERMERLQRVISTYVIHNKKYPCPANLFQKKGWVHDCSVPGPGSVPKESGIKVYDIDPGRKAESGINEVWTGLVPVQELGLTPEQVVDGWGNQFTYAVSRRLTFHDSVKPSKIKPPEGIVSIKDENGAPVTRDGKPAHFVIVSHGPNGAGAIKSLRGRKACLLTEAEGENCDGDDSFLRGVYSEGKNIFDDLLLYNFPLQDDSSIEQILLCNGREKFYAPDLPHADPDGCAYPYNPWHGTCTYVLEYEHLQLVDQVTGQTIERQKNLKKQAAENVRLPGKKDKGPRDDGKGQGEICGCSAGYQLVSIRRDERTTLPEQVDPAKYPTIKVPRVKPGTPPHILFAWTHEVRDFSTCMRDNKYVPLTETPEDGKEKKPW